jgi:arsenate reductase
MYEDGFDLSNKKPKSVFELFKQGRLYSHVITVCQDSVSKCPVFPGITKPWHWPFPDPTAVEGSEADKLTEVRRIRDKIKDWILNPPANTIDFNALISN